jgi:hypothetical protein
MNATEIQKHWNDRIEAALQPLRDLMAEMLREHVANLHNRPLVFNADEERVCWCGHVGTFRTHPANGCGMGPMVSDESPSQIHSKERS